MWKWTGGYIYQVVSGEFPFAATNSKKKKKKKKKIELKNFINFLLFSKVVTAKKRTTEKGNWKALPKNIF